MQTSASIIALPSAIDIASTGQVPKQASHPTQAALSTTAFAITQTSYWFSIETMRHNGHSD